MVGGGACEIVPGGITDHHQMIGAGERGKVRGLHGRAGRAARGPNAGATRDHIIIGVYMEYRRAATAAASSGSAPRGLKHRK